MPKKILAIALCIILNFTGFTQSLPDSVLIDINSIKDSALITKKTYLFFDSMNVATDENIAGKKFVPLTDYANN